MANNKKNQVEDIFAETDKDKKPVSQRPKVAQPAVPKKRPAGAPASLPTPPGRAPGMVKRSKRPLIVLLIFVVVVGVGVVLWQSNIFTNKEVANSPGEAVTAPAVSVNTQPVNERTVELPTVNTSVVDTDGDGLTDEEEKKLGTNIKNKDTDGDKLFDREEVKIYKTDPKKSDTDGDGVVDGIEVANGYNPNGPGKLLDLQAEIEKLP